MRGEWNSVCDAGDEVSVRSRMGLAVTVSMIVAVGACCDSLSREPSVMNRVPPDTDPKRGREVIEQFGCGGCHVIPGVTGAHGLKGPPLLWFARRDYVAGELPNTFENVVAFLESPQSIHPHSAMPAAGLGHHQAGDVAAYLYTLR